MMLALSLAAILAQGPSRVALMPFQYGDVTVTGGPMAAQMRFARDYFLDLNEDSLLQGFRLRAGKAAPGKPMGGWYDPDGFAAAHPFGQYISALARFYANTGDSRYKAKVARLVHGFHAAMSPDGFFFASQKVAREWPCYIYDKMCIAMRDAYTLTGNSEALDTLKRMTDWAFTRLPRRSDEWYTLPENLYKCYELTHDKRYLTMARQYDYSKEYYDVFARGDNGFTPDRHAYSHVNSLSSSAKAYEFSGNPKYLRATETAWSYLTTTQMYASGGWGPDERFVEAGKGKLAESLSTSVKNFETPCGTYANVNLDRYLLRFTGDPKYGDNMERVLLNGMLAALPPEKDGKSFYYSNYKAGAKKEFFGDVWPCCNGTYAETPADYPLDIYFHTAKSLYINLFTDSTVRWKTGSQTVQVTQRTDYPVRSTISLKVRLDQPKEFALDLRSPSWCSTKPRVRVNGKQVPLATGLKGLVSVNRVWRNGDTMDVDFPPSLGFEPIDTLTPDRCALMFGPLLLVALADKDVELTGDRSKPEAWIRPVPGSPSEFLSNGGVRFRPLYLVGGESYTTYCHIH